ncbi:carbohydrate ABC transporter permease [Oscillospiraceae bacterium HV4-5-C5C]|nr:carbohydrate ABC transporter permease [Oscillospiraceae bacterium HV4-5-C5C]
MKRHLSTAIFNCLLLIWTLFPVYWLLSLAVRSQGELIGHLRLWPERFSLEHFTALLADGQFSRTIVNSMKVTLLSTGFSLALGLGCAYILARLQFRFALRGPLLVWSFLVRVLPPIAFAMPLYMLMNRAGLLSSLVPLTLTHILMNLPFIIWFMIAFFQRFPLELEESARMDGASEWRCFRSVVLPVTAPGIAAVGILSFMTSWNEYLYAVIFVQSPANFTIPLALATFNSEQELAKWGQLAAGGVISALPVVLFVCFAQRFLIQGLSGGAVKE